MPTMDASGGTGSDHRQGAPGPGRGAGPPSVRTIQISPKVAGCGCFGCSSALILSGGLMLVMIVSTALLPSWRANYRYVPGTCRVVETRLGSHEFETDGIKGAAKKTFRPEIKIRYEVAGRTFETWTYDATGAYFKGRAAQQAIVDSFRVGSTYPFWHDPDRPDQAVLVRDNPGFVYLLLVPPVGLLALGSLGILLSRRAVTAGTVPESTPGLPPPAEAPPMGSLRRLGFSKGAPDQPIDPASFGDPVAMKTDWTPFGGSGASYWPRTLVEAGSDRLKYRATVKSLLIGLALLAAGILGDLAIIFGLSRGRFRRELLPPLGIGLSAAAAGVYVLYACTTPVVFDKRSGFFWKGWKAPDVAPGGNSVRLGEIHAVQILKYGVSTGKGGYTAYELNLVLINGDRIKFATYVDLHHARRDAPVVAGFLGRSVWGTL